MFDDQAQKNYQQEEKRSKFFSQVTVQVKQLEKTNFTQGIMVIQTNYISNSQLVAVVVRKISQFDALVQYLTTLYGGRLIPCYDYAHDIQSTNAQQIKRIQQYLIDMKSHLTCSRDLKLYEFIFFQIVEFPEQETFYKILTKATIFSRTYLNSFFTRKQLDKDVQEFRQFMIAHKKMEQFIHKFSHIKDIVLILLEQHQALESIMSDLSELSQKMSLNAIPTQLQASKIRSNISYIQKQLAFTIQANQRIQMLSINIRQIKANINKGLHEQKRQCLQKQKLLKNWAFCLSRQFSRLLEEIIQLCQEISTNVYIMQKIQFQENCLQKIIRKTKLSYKMEQMQKIAQINENTDPNKQFSQHNEQSNTQHYASQQNNQEISIQPQQQQNAEQNIMKSKNEGQYSQQNIQQKQN